MQDDLSFSSVARVNDAAPDGETCHSESTLLLDDTDVSLGDAKAESGLHQPYFLRFEGDMFDGCEVKAGVSFMLDFWDYCSFVHLGDSDVDVVRFRLILGLLVNCEDR